MRIASRLLPVLACLLALSCNPIADDNRSAVTLSAAFSDSGSSTAIGFSIDVVDNETGQPHDEALEVTVYSTPKVDTLSTALYTVHFLSYDVLFSRPDGQNEPGVDVPFPFSRAIGGIVEPEGTADLNIIMITEEMKLQSPLRDLWFGDGERLFTTLHITIFGRDRVENSVQASASAPVIFDDF